MDCHSFLQRLFPTQGSNPGLLPAPGLLHCRWILYCLNHQGRLHQDHERQSEMESHSVVSDSLQSHGLYSPRNSPGQNTGVGSLSLLQGIFPPQRWNPGLPHCEWILYQLSHKGSPSGGHQFISVGQSCPTLCDPMNRSTPGLPVHHQLPEFTQTHVHRVSDAIQPSHPL